MNAPYAAVVSRFGESMGWHHSVAPLKATDLLGAIAEAERVYGPTVDVYHLESSGELREHAAREARERAEHERLRAKFERSTGEGQ